MKKLLIAFCVLLLAGEVNAQTQPMEIVDGAYKREKFKKRPPIPLAPIREADVMYSWNILRVLDLNQKPNLTPEEIEKINSLQQKIQNIILSLGEIEFQKIQLEKQYEYQKHLLNQVEEEEYLLEQELSKKYDSTEQPTE
jgi:hypothetical protein